MVNHETFDKHMRELARKFGFEFKGTRRSGADENRDRELYMYGQSGKFRRSREREDKLEEDDNE
jgi:hypothetical protein